MTTNTSVNITFNILGNANEGLLHIANNVKQLTQQIDNSTSVFKKIGDLTFIFNQVSQALQTVNHEFQNMIQPGISFQSSLADLSAITGLVGKNLEEIGAKARENAKIFGLSAATSVESYKLLLSQLGPEIAKTPEALELMGKNVAILSKTMGGDIVAATEVLTTAMNQFQVSLEDPIAASRTMTRMMNIMAEAAKQGSAELPAIKVALENAGMTAKMAGVSFAETNAAIQALDKAGKKGAEGGIALRNVIATLSQGRFLPEGTKEELARAGIDVNHLTNQSLSLTERLRPLQNVLSDTALITKLFGKENQAAAIALISNLDYVEELTQTITNTNTAFEQSEVVMNTYAERMKRLTAWFDDLKISIFNATEPFIPFIQLSGSAIEKVVLMGQFINGLKIIFDTKFGKMLLNAGQQLITFGINTWHASVSLVRLATVGTWNAVRGIAQYIVSLVTAGNAATVFTAKSATSFATFRTVALTSIRSITAAITSIPIIGWISIAITLIITYWDEIKAFFSKLVSWFSSIFSKVGAWFSNMWESISKSVQAWLIKIKNIILKYHPFAVIINAIDSIFPGFKQKLNELLNWFMDKFVKPIKEAWNWIKGLFGSGKTNEKQPITKPAKLPEQKPLTIKPQTIKQTSQIEQLHTKDEYKTYENSIKTSESIKNYNISINSLIHELTVHSQTMEQSIEDFADKLKKVLLQVVNDINYIPN